MEAAGYDMVVSQHLGGILLSFFFEVCTSTGPVDALKVQSSNFNTKVSRMSPSMLIKVP